MEAFMANQNRSERVWSPFFTYMYSSINKLINAYSFACEQNSRKIYIYICITNLYMKSLIFTPMQNFNMVLVHVV